MTRLLPAIALSLLVFSLAAPVVAASPEVEHELEVERIRTEIRRISSRLDEIRSRARSAEVELQEAELQLQLRSRELEIALETRGELERQRTVIGGEVAALHDRIGRQKRALATRLAMLYRFGRLSYFRMLLTMDEQKNPFEAVTMLSYLVTRDARTVRQFQDDREKLALRAEELEARRTQIDRMQRVVEERKVALERSRREKEQLLARLRRESERDSRRLEELRDKAARLERLFALLYQRSDPDRFRGEDIRSYRGALPWPLEGKIIERFGRHRSDRFATWTVSNGIRIGAQPGRPVHAVFAGTVLYADWFKGYGNLVIVDHGNRIFSLYGNTRGLRVRKGDRVAPGQQLGLAAEAEEESGGYLYFEIRENNQPIDPVRWLR